MVTIAVNIVVATLIVLVACYLYWRFYPPRDDGRHINPYILPKRRKKSWLKRLMKNFTKG